MLQQMYGTIVLIGITFFWAIWSIESLAKDTVFTDEDFRKTLGKNDAGIIYIWSPHMPLSIRAMHAAKGAAKKLHLKFVQVMDPAAQKQAVERAVASDPLLSRDPKRLESSELLGRGMIIHFPSLLVYSSGKIRGGLVPGAKDEKIYLKLIRKELTQP